jgi:hypothetical protein
MINNSNSINKTNNHLSLKSLNTKSRSCQTCDGVKLARDTIHFDSWIFNTDLNKQLNTTTQNRFHSKRPHAITKMNDGINTGSII